MKRLVLANIDYEPTVNGRGGHMTNEGMQLQRGLEVAGWVLAGAGFGDGCRDVPMLIERHRPDIVFVQDKRDWDPSSTGAFRKDIGFTKLSFLAERQEIFKVAVVKDAGTMVDYQRGFCEEIAADAVVNYYSEESVLAGSPWLTNYPRIRTWHTLDPIEVAGIDLRQERKRALVSGAYGQVYPLRCFIIANKRRLRVEQLEHPGYGNRGAHTGRYLRHLAGFKVHLTTSSQFHFALRKIIESVAVGCTPITNLPYSDNLPGIDGALIRIPDEISVGDLCDVIDRAEQAWDFDERFQYAKIAADLYDFRRMGQLLSDDIVRAATMKRDSVHA
jgi:hypothetical protein